MTGLIHAHVYIHTCMSVCTCVYIYMRILTYIYTHTSATYTSTVTALLTTLEDKFPNHSPSAEQDHLAKQAEQAALEGKAMADEALEL